MNHKFGISQSALSVYRSCPFAYLCYKQKKDAIMFSQDPLDSGKAVHDAISRYYKNNYLTQGSYEDILSLTYRNLTNIWDTMLPVAELQKAFTCLQHHAKWEENNINSGLSSKPLTEEKLSTEIFFGIIDYIDLNKKLAIDWKTNKSSFIGYDYKVQSYIYKLLYEEMFKEELKMFHFFFLYPDVMHIIRFDSKDMLQIKEDVNQASSSLLKSIENNDFPKQPRTEKGCNGCAYRLYCKY